MGFDCLKFHSEPYHQRIPIESDDEYYYQNGYWSVDYPIRTETKRWRKEPTLNVPNFRLFLIALKVMKKARRKLPPLFVIREEYEFPQYYHH